MGEIGSSPVLAACFQLARNNSAVETVYTGYQIYNFTRFKTKKSQTVMTIRELTCGS
jgi:hypothetical protein